MRVNESIDLPRRCPWFRALASLFAGYITLDKLTSLNLVFEIEFFFFKKRKGRSEIAMN